jgi:hypothetical protein
VAGKVRRWDATAVHGFPVKAVGWSRVEITIWAEVSPCQADKVAPGVVVEEVAWVVVCTCDRGSSQKRGPFGLGRST